MKSNKTDNYLLWVVIFMTFLGFYSILLLSLNAGMSGGTRVISSLMRIIIVVCCLLIFLRNVNVRNIEIKWFIVFTFIFMIRVFLDYSSNKYFYIPYKDLVFYYFSFVFIPFIGISKIDFSKINIRKLYKVFLLSALLFSSLTIILYGKFIGAVSRLSTSSAGEAVVSPLILSYCGVLIIGVVSFYLFYNKNEKPIIKFLSWSAIIMSSIPFFLGASRGGIIALFFPFVLMLFSSLSFKNILKTVLFSAISIIALIFLDSYFESGLLDRFTGTAEAIETGSSSASRLQIWDYSIQQFIDNPLFGDSLNTKIFNFYPHNIFLEVMQQTGLVGFVPFLMITISAIAKSFKVIKYYPKYAWLTIFFLQSLVQSSFSGAIYSSAWYWAGIAMVIALYKYLERNISKKNIKGSYRKA